ncbi:flagellar basal-body rod protein FlgB [Pseudomonas alcaligenes]|uniref:Flagellar basal body rod protein FlgB n=1 Tax=Aquipseudomonas alcaligenes TaxID=43263 RepID=A0ABR7RYM0_AQUAC|nr:flagellar basal body rod protein FlgB [Pseudomonas alcaligenes]MBC9249847.1 flagellar basal-body rod protein FlgB [Pseudomonas alcaligenes]
MSIRVEEALGVHVRALDLRMQRSEILAANLANEDTPGFQARDIDFAGEMQRLDSDAALQIASADDGAALKYRLPGQPAQDGNTVELSVEQAEFSRNSMDFQTGLTFIGMQFRGLKQAIEGR